MMHTIGWITRSPLLLVLLALTVVSGCACYRVGARSLFRSDIQSVHVPIFESDSMRRNLGEQLTEAVVKELQLRSQYRVTTSAAADSVLSGTIVSDSKRMILENAFDEPRNLELGMVVQLNWIDRRTGTMLLENINIPIAPIALTIASDANFVPEAGQSLETARRQVLQDLAAEIVNQMEMRW
ncbi:MAG: hypothetical protein ACI9G1_001730 [Pirellulaceae bacterium]|jgi:hypothetical protein